MPRIFKVVIVLFVVVFSVFGLALLLSGVLTLFRTANTGGIGSVAGGVSFGFLKLIAVVLIVLAVGLIGLTRLGRFLR
jgi:hypothetical protein